MIRAWIRRFQASDYTPEQATSEYIELLMKAGRRCAYDLRHAADSIENDSEFRNIMYKRASHWQTVFNPANEQKNYRHKLHNMIDELEDINAQLIKRCKANGIDVSDLEDDDIPF